MNYYKISSKDIVVASDDTYLEAGILRIRFGGTSGGHNGLKSVIEAIGPDFWRVRLGIGPNGNIPLEDFVLTRIPGEQEKLMTSMIDKAVLEMISFLSDKKFENKTIN
jgi:PTH1 family peptidyl-tRNA hydrolase